MRRESEREKAERGRKGRKWTDEVLWIVVAQICNVIIPGGVRAVKSS